MLAQGPHTPSAPFGEDESHGQDAIAARGDLWARDIGESFGAGGLGLSGIGEGGGGRGEGIGLGSIGLLGHTDGRPGPGTGGDGFRSGRMGGAGVIASGCATASRAPPRGAHGVATPARSTVAAPT
ncbi:MAG: hypothetical protein QM820_17235 [Minicystis sp.]